MLCKKHDSYRYLSKKMIPYKVYQKNAIPLYSVSKISYSCQCESTNTTPLDVHRKKTIPYKKYQKNAISF